MTVSNLQNILTDNWQFIMIVVVIVGFFWNIERSIIELRIEIQKINSITARVEVLERSIVDQNLKNKDTQYMIDRCLEQINN